MAKGVISDADVEAYGRDGFVLVRGMRLALRRREAAWIRVLS